MNSNVARRSNIRDGIAVVFASAFLPLAAFATSTAPDTSSITTEITDYAAAAVLLVMALLLARWGIHALGLFRPKG